MVFVMVGMLTASLWPSFKRQQYFIHLRYGAMRSYDYIVL